MAKLDLENDGVEVVEMSVAQARDTSSDDFYDLISSQLDEAQAHAFEGRGDAYLVIKILKAPD